MEDLTYDQRVENEKKKAMDAYRWTLDNPVKANIISTTGILGGVAGGIGSGRLAQKYLGTGTFGTMAAGVAGGILSHLIASSLASYLVRKAEKESLENEARIRKFRETGKIAATKDITQVMDEMDPNHKDTLLMNINDQSKNLMGRKGFGAAYMLAYLRDRKIEKQHQRDFEEYIANTKNKNFQKGCESGLIAFEVMKQFSGD